MTDDELNSYMRKDPGEDISNINIGDVQVKMRSHKDGKKYFYYNSVRAYLDRIKMFIKGNYTSLVVGYSNNRKECIMHKDADYYYIGCLKEPRKSFLKKYIKLKKGYEK